MPGLPNGPILVFYNGFLFPVETNTEVTVRPVEDASGRTIKFLAYKIRVKSFIGRVNQEAGETTDDTMDDLQARLTAYGGELHFEDCGFGKVVCNVPPAGPTVGVPLNPTDVVWGPKPTMILWKPIGQVAAEIEWEVEVHLAPCDDAKYEDEDGILERVFTVSEARDASGYLTRTIRGHVTIPQTRATVTTRTLGKTADPLKEKMASIFSTPVGFRRTFPSWELSMDKCTLRFTIVDTEMGPNYFPVNAVDCKMSHFVNSMARPVATGTAWAAVLQATYEMRRGVQRATAMNHFLTVLNTRVNWTAGTPFRPYKQPQTTQTVLYLDVRIGEPEVYGRNLATFAVTYQFMSSLADLLNTSSLFRPLPNSDYQAWHDSLSGDRGPATARGSSGLAFDASTDAIIDLCDQTTPPSPSPQGKPFPPDPPAPTPPAIKNPTPPPETSWLRYESWFRLEQIDEVIELKPLPSSTPTPTPPAQPPSQVPQPPAFGIVGPAGPSLPSTSGGAGVNYVGPAVEAAGGAGIASSSSNPVPIVQRRAAPTFYAHLTGRAVRAGHPVVPPRLLTVGGRAVEEANVRGGGFKPGIRSSLFGVIIYEATWHFRYLVVGTPTGDLPIMDSPFRGW